MTTGALVAGGADFGTDAIARGEAGAGAAGGGVAVEGLGASVASGGAGLDVGGSVTAVVVGGTIVEGKVVANDSTVDFFDASRARVESVVSGGTNIATATAVATKPNPRALGIIRRKKGIEYRFLFQKGLAEVGDEGGEARGKRRMHRLSHYLNRTESVIPAKTCS